MWWFCISRLTTGTFICSVRVYVVTNGHAYAAHRCPYKKFFNNGKIVIIFFRNIIIPHVVVRQTFVKKIICNWQINLYIFQSHKPMRHDQFHLTVQYR